MSRHKATLVSVVVINFNSKDFLRQCIGSVLELDWPELEVIVVDNASSDGSADMVIAEFGGRAHLIRRTQNSPTAGRNEGFRAARGEYILSLDNDIVLTDRRLVHKAVPIFRQFPKVAALAFKIGTIENPEKPLPEHWWHPVSLAKGKDRFFFTDYFSEGAVFFRAEAVRDAGGYDEVFFRGYEGNDLTFKLFRSGYDLLFCPDLFCGELRVRGFHHQARKEINYLCLRNKIWLVWKYYPFWRGLRYLASRIAVAGYRSVRFAWIGYFVKGVKDGICAPKAIRKQRRPLSKEVWNRIDNTHRGMFEEAETWRGSDSFFAESYRTPSP